MVIKVLIADDHAVVADGLRFVVEAQPDMQVLGCVPNGREAVNFALEHTPDVVLLDHEMPLLNGTEAVRILRERLPTTRTILLSMHSNRVHVLRALQAGARGYVVKKSAAKEVVEAIRAVHEGRRFLSRLLTDQVIGFLMKEPDSIDPLEKLSSREMQVLQLVAEGRTSGEISRALSISLKTVETYRRRVMDKLEIPDFAALVKFAVRQGITSLDQ